MGLVCRWVGKLECGHTFGGTSIPPVPGAWSPCGPCGEDREVLDVVTDVPLRTKDDRAW